MTALDESKEEREMDQADLQSRAYALETAKLVIMHTQHDAHCLIDVARDIYLFITGRDPVLDLMGDQEDDSNVIVLNQYR